MIIRTARKVRTADAGPYAWSGLRKFQNVDLVAKKLVEIHEVPKKYHEDVRKQAQQLRYCLIQAREYFTAARSVTTATKPNLLYYGTMSLALAEILFKRSGKSSLDKAREEHRHHGLSMTAGAITRGADLDTAASLIRARPHEVSGVRRGTFELWHRSSREHPLGGSITTYLDGGGSNIGYNVILGAIDVPYPPIPIAGITLADCLSSLPLMLEHLGQTNLSSTLVRGKCQSEMWTGASWRMTNDIIFHPSPLYSKVQELVRVNPNSVDRVEVREAGTGALVRVQSDYINGFVGMPLPPAATINSDEWRMWTNSPPLNEFGYLYVAIYLAGNYARYFPDKWLLDVETSTPLALAIEELCLATEWRAPWLTLGELDQTMYVLEA